MTAVRSIDGDGRRRGREIPHNVEAEESLIGAMLLSADAIDTAAAIARPDDFYVPDLAVLFEHIVAVHGNGQRIDPVSFAEHLNRAGLLEQIGGRTRLFDLQRQTPASANAHQYVRIVVDCAAYRTLIAAGGAIQELGYERDLEPIDAVARATEMIRDAEVPLGGIPSEHVGDFLERSTDHTWMWPGILEVNERLLLVAPEKYGKSTMIRQIAVCLSQGVDPYRQHHIPPVLVHLVDLENPETMVRRKLGAMYDTVFTLDRQPIPEMLRIDCWPEGLDLANSRADELQLFEKIAANRAEWTRLGFEPDYPMLLAIGPVYKMLDDELQLGEVRRLQRSLDRIRKRFHCALLLETHAPHESFGPKAGARSLRPAGPRSWLRWPEFCRALEPTSSIAVAAGDQQNVADFYDVQGARDERDWPLRLRRGGRLPWIEDSGI